MNTMKVGDEVRIFLRNRYHPDPDGGHVGAIVRVGRKYAAAEYDATYQDHRGRPVPATRTIEFDMNTGSEKGDYYGAQVRTPEQLVLDVRRENAEKFLRKHGVELNRRFDFTLEEVEALAEVARTFAEAGQ